jgi:cytochrome c peroxidase
MSPLMVSKRYAAILKRFLSLIKEKTMTFRKIMKLSSGLLLGVSFAAAAQTQGEKRPFDAIADAQTPRPVQSDRPEQQKTEHDRSDMFSPNKPSPLSPALKDQPKSGRISGFDFYRDPLNADRPMQKPEDIMQKETAGKVEVMDAQKKLLEQRYNLTANTDPSAKMSRGKPLAVGPTARLPSGMTWDKLGEATPEEIKSQGIFPYPPLPHPLHANGGQVFPKMQIDMFPRLERFDVDFDLPEAFLPEFPPAIFLNNRPELGDVSRGEVVSINNYYRLFKDILTPVQLDGLRLLLTPFPQEEFNPTDDRKTKEPSLGVTCFDCHVNGHTVGLRSVEDFTEFEQRTAYFNGDPIHAIKKGMNILDRIQVSHMAQMQNMLDFPPAPKLNPATGRLDPAKATESEARGEKVFFGKGQCANCHMPPTYLDHQMHDLHLERFVNEPGDGAIKTFTLRGIKDSPPYLHDGRALTLEDTVEFFNIVLQLKLNAQEKQDLVAFMRQL